MGDLVGIDLAVVIGVEGEEEALGVGLHLVGGQQPVMIAVGLLEPVGKRVLALLRARKGSPIGLMNSRRRIAWPGGARFGAGPAAAPPRRRSGKDQRNRHQRSFVKSTSGRPQQVNMR